MADEGEEKSERTWSEAELMEEALAQAAQPPRRGVGRPRRRGPYDKTQLTVKQRLFLEYYARTLNATEAARLAGYTHASVGARLLKRLDVQEQMRALVAAQVERKGINKQYLTDKVQAVLEEGKPFERLKAAELLSKMLGYFAPVKPDRGLRSGEGPYAELIQTLRNHGDSFTDAERVALRDQLQADMLQIQEALGMLGGAPLGGH